MYHTVYTRNLLSTSAKDFPKTIVCGGQSPSYYCLAMMNFSIFNPDLVNIVILPHSKGGLKSVDKISENITYCERLTEKNITLNKNVVIIDGVHSGTGILALESALKHCFPSINVFKIAINSQKGISKIPVNKEIILPCQSKFSDVFPRLVTSFHPCDFNDSAKFITDFINVDNNPVAKMIIDIAKTYPEIQVEETDWYKLNNEITDEIVQKRAQKKAQKRAQIAQQEKEAAQNRIQKAEAAKNRFFTPIVLTNPKKYQCPICKTITGTQAPLNPRNTSFFTHNIDCMNKFKIAIE